MSDESSTLQKLQAVIADRKANPSEKSYTTKLLNGGTKKIGEKILEEAQEVIEAADEVGEEGRKHLIYEAGDVLYHLMVLLGHRDVKFEEIEEELARRFDIGGLEEKANRSQSPSSE